MGIRFKEGIYQKEFLYFRDPNTGDTYLRDDHPYFELYKVVIAKGGAAKHELSWDGHWNVKIIKKYFGMSVISKHVFEAKTNVLFRDWNHLLKHLHNNGFLGAVFKEIFEG